MIIYVPHIATTGDPLFASVLLLEQRGLLVDTSSYARSIADQTGTLVSTNQTDADFPSGKCVHVNAAHNASGLIIGYGSELEIGTNDPFCLEAFVKLDTGALAGGTQVLYNAGFGFGGFLWFLQITTGRQFIRVNSSADIGSDDAYVDHVAEGACSYLCAQVYDDDSVWMWVGEVGNPTAAGSVCSGAFPRPVDAITDGPYIGYVGGSGGTNAYKYDQYRITKGVRIAQGTGSIPIPTALFPEF